MAIIARCPNPACGQSLQVPDEYAGQQAPCPMCNTMVTFAAPPPPTPPTAPMPRPPLPPPAPPAPSAGFPVAPPPPPPSAGFAVAPPPATPPAPGGYPPPPGVSAGYPPPPAPGGYPPAGPPGYAPLPPAGPPMSTAELVQLITVPAGLFFLLLLIIAAFLPWFGVTVPEGFSDPVSGLYVREAGLFLVGCLLLGTAVGLTYLWKDLLPRVAVGAAGFGIFAFFFMLGTMLSPAIRHGMSARAGVWVGFVAAIFAAGAFVTLAFFHPLELGLAGVQGTSPFLKRYGALLIGVGAGAGLGVVYLLLAALA